MTTKPKVLNVIAFLTFSTMLMAGQTQMPGSSSATGKADSAAATNICSRVSRCCTTSSASKRVEYMVCPNQAQQISKKHERVAHQTVQGIVFTQWHSCLSDRGHKDQIKEKLQPGARLDWLGSADQSRTGRTGMSVCQFIENSHWKRLGIRARSHQKGRTFS